MVVVETVDVNFCQSFVVSDLLVGHISNYFIGCFYIAPLKSLNRIGTTCMQFYYLLGEYKNIVRFTNLHLVSSRKHFSLRFPDF